MIYNRLTVSNLVALALIIVIYITSCKATSNTTEATNDTTVSTTTTTETTTTTTETTTDKTVSPIVTTAAPSVTTVAPVQVDLSLNTETGVTTCTCDMTGHFCDINCCCDPDCTTDDVVAFTSCTEISLYSPINYCVSEGVVYRDQSDYVTTKTTDDLLCIYNDNYAERNYYSEVQPVSGPDQFEYLLQENTDSADISTYSTQDTISYPQQYQYALPVYTYYEQGAIGEMVFPAPELSGTTCSYTRNIGFYVADSSECISSVTAATCLEELSLENYITGFKVVANSSFFEALEIERAFQTVAASVATSTVSTTSTMSTNSTMSTTSATTSTTSTTTMGPDIYDTGYALLDISIECIRKRTYVNGIGIDGACLTVAGDIQAAQTSSYSGTTCSNALIELEYRFEITEGVKISIVQVNAIVADIDTSSTSQITRSFSTYFGTNLSATDVIERSGNPGYQTGKGVIVGKLTADTSGSNTAYSMTTESGDGLYMTVIRSAMDGTCATDTSKRVIVGFGETLRSGCFIRLNLEEPSSQCGSLQDQIVTALEGPFNPANTDPWYYVARFGNYDNLKIGDWVPILTSGRPSNIAETDSSTIILGRCENIVTGLRIDILYANTGAISNPQAKIVGVQYTYERGTISYRCDMFTCRSGITAPAQKVEISSTVNFIDVSKTAEGALAQPPKIQTNLPYNLFYPFLLDSSATNHKHISVLQIILAGLIIILHLHL